MESKIKEKYSNMLEPFETMGQWWIPDSKDVFSGTFKYIPQEEVLELKFIGKLEKGPIIKNIKIINGLTVGGQYMTLVNCFAYMDSFRAPGYVTTKAIPQFVFVGFCFKTIEEIIFNKATYSCYNNEDFMGESGFKSEHLIKDNKVEYDLSYKYPEPINFKIEDFDISTTWQVTWPSVGPEIDIREKAGFVIKSSKCHTHIEFLNTPITRVNTLLEIIIGERVPIREVILISEKIGRTFNDGEFYTQPISLLWKQPISYPLPKRKTPFELVFSFYEIKNEINNIIQKWHETHQRYKTAIGLFLTVLRMRKDLSIEHRFLNLCHVLEVYHRLKSSETYMDPEKYKLLLENIIGVVPQEHQQYIRQRLQYGNELMLRKRVKQIYDLLPIKIQERIGEKKSFCDKIVNTRNYLTHYDKNIKSLALSNVEMIKYETFMINMCKALFLLEAGLSHEKINEKLGDFYIPETIKFQDE
jgi:hypothetical protein